MKEFEVTETNDIKRVDPYLKDLYNERCSLLKFLENSALARKIRSALSDHLKEIEKKIFDREKYIDWMCDNTKPQISVKSGPL